jgi:hypothetical protein
VRAARKGEMWWTREETETPTDPEDSDRVSRGARAAFENRLSPRPLACKARKARRGVPTGPFERPQAETQSVFKNQSNRLIS